MKRCPQCDAEYDDHVEYCFVDGAQLVQQTDRVAAASLPPPPEASPSSRLLPLVLALGAAAVVALIVVAGVLVYVVVGGEGDQRSAGEAEVPSTDAISEPVQPSGALAATAAFVSVQSTPSGAQIWEGNTQLCPSTPCEVEHPEHAPIPRTFRVHLDGYEDGPIEMVDVRRAYEVELQRAGADTPPAPRPRPRSRPSPTASKPPTDAPQAILDER